MCALHFVKDQKQWLESIRDMLYYKPSLKLKPPLNKQRRIVFKIVTSPYFEYFITALIVLNIIIMSIQTYDQTSEKAAFLDSANDILMFVFVGEMVFKWIGVGFRQYFVDRWNIFDCIVVVCIHLFFFLFLIFNVVFKKGHVNLVD